ncbi:MAG: hypothetical protein ABI156_04310 [Caldimonas sp.]
MSRSAQRLGDWIPAFAGMTGYDSTRHAGLDPASSALRLSRLLPL